MQGAACSDSVDGQNKGVSRSAAPVQVAFPPPLLVRSMPSPSRTTWQCQYYCQQMRRDSRGRKRRRRQAYCAACASVCECVPACMCVCQFSQLTATVAEPRTLDSIDCTCQTGEIINAIGAASAAHYCN